MEQERIQKDKERDRVREDDATEASGAHVIETSAMKTEPAVADQAIGMLLDGVVTSGDPKRAQLRPQTSEEFVRAFVQDTGE
jgi:hypothetical protein